MGDFMAGFSSKAQCRKRLQECINKLHGVSVTPVTNMVFTRADSRKLFDIEEDLKKIMAKLK